MMRYWFLGWLSISLGMGLDRAPAPDAGRSPGSVGWVLARPPSGGVPPPASPGRGEPWWDGFALRGPRRPYRRRGRPGRGGRGERSGDVSLGGLPRGVGGAGFPQREGWILPPPVPVSGVGVEPASGPGVEPASGPGVEPASGPGKRGRPATIDTRFHFCPYPPCTNYGKMGPGNQIVGNGHCSHDKSHQLLLCKVCGRSFCERRGTVFFGCKTPQETIYRALATLAEGVGPRAVARIFGVDKDTVCRWLKKAAQHSEQVSDYLMKDLNVPEVQLDELWTFVQKKEKNLSAWEKLHTEYGDTWVWVAFDPLYKLVVAHVEGEREEAEAEALLQKVKNRLAPGLIPLFTSDRLVHYATALLKVFGRPVQPARQGSRGRFPKPRWVAVPGLVYGVVVKHRVGKWVGAVTTQVIYGTWRAVWTRLAASVSGVVNTAFVERMNLTLRQGCRCLARKSNAFSRKREWLTYQLEVAIAYYHFVRPHGSLRQRLPQPEATKGTGSPKVWQERTPAMAAGLTDHVWTREELLSFRGPGGASP